MKSEDVDILKFIHTFQMNELMFRREREFKIFFWSGTLFLGLISLLLILEENEDAVWKSYGTIGTIITSIAVIILGLFSISWQNRERYLGNQNIKVISKINKLLHCFDAEYFDLEKNAALFPLKWSNWGETEVYSIKRYFRANLITATWLLCLLVLIMIWVT
jgi:hypothetical protein